MSPNPQEPANLVAFTAEILNGKLDFLCSASSLFFFYSEWYSHYHMWSVKENEINFGR